MSLDARHTPLVRESWTRCRLAGLDPSRTPPLRYVMPEGAAAPGLGAVAQALSHAEGLYRSLAGQPAVMLLADTQLLLLSSVGAPPLRLRAAAAGATPGANWSEEVRGTNALALAARFQRAITICGQEHYFESLWDWSGTALPLPREIGVLGLYAPGERVHECALALLETCAGPLVESLAASARREPGAPARALAGLGRKDPAVALAVDRVTRILGREIPLLIQGETGTGKEVFARAFHYSGPRGAGPFVAVNCAAIPAALIEAELFGHVEGAFTGARRDGSPGKLRLADGGTLFLDEIGDMPLALQSVLLRVMETRRVTALGDREEHEIDVGFVCATHQPLRELVARSAFRADLFFRLSGMTIELPPLRQRADFGALAQEILDEESPFKPLRLAPEALLHLRARSWPGNLRELRNVLRLAVAMLGDEDELRVAHFEGLAPESAGGLQDRARTLREAEAELVKQAVARHGGNVSAAARELKITRTTLYRRLRGE